MKIGRSPPPVKIIHEDSCRYCSTGFTHFLDLATTSEVKEILKWLSTNLDIMPDGSFCLCGESKESEFVHFLLGVLEPEIWRLILGRIENDNYLGEKEVGVDEWQRIRGLLRERLEDENFESFFEGVEIDWLAETRKVEDDLRDRRHQTRKTRGSKGMAPKKSRSAE